MAEEPLPEAPINSDIYLHWLVIDGFQPRIPENPMVESSTKLDVNLPVDISSTLSKDLRVLHSNYLFVILFTLCLGLL